MMSSKVTSMTKEEIFPQLINEISNDLGLDRSQLSGATCLFSDFDLEPEDIHSCILHITEMYKVQLPTINDFAKYNRAISRHNNRTGVFALLARLNSTPQIKIPSTFSIDTLCEIIVLGNWPQCYLTPPGYTD